jgi:hypothetical protein
MSKLSFRARALDANKPLQIYRSENEPDILNENVAISRSVPQLPTGMEKEEEEVIARTLCLAVCAVDLCLFMQYGIFSCFLVQVIRKTLISVFKFLSTPYLLVMLILNSFMNSKRNLISYYISFLHSKNNLSR